MAGVEPAPSASSMRNRLNDGELLDLGDPTKGSISAEWLLELVGPDCTVTVAINIHNATIDGALDLSSVTFKRSVTMFNCHFTGRLILEYASLQSYANFDECTFDQGVNLHAAHVASDLTFKRATFAGTMDDVNQDAMRRANVANIEDLDDDEKQHVVNMEDLHVDEVLNASGATFAHGDKAQFGRLRVGKSLVCKRSRARATTFWGGATFIDAQVGSQAEFDGAHFATDVDFSGLNVEDAAFFRDHVHFGGKALFRSANFKAEAVFNEATFCREVRFGNTHFQDLALFRHASFENDAYFDQVTVGTAVVFGRDPKRAEDPSTFGGNLYMRGAKFHGTARFTEVAFDADAQIAAEFLGEALFESTVFKSVSFDRSSFPETVTFDRAEFRESASFQGVRFGHRASFAGSIFRHEADFTSAEATGDFYFVGATFEASATFAYSSLKLVSFQDALTETSDSRQFLGPLTLVGCTYDRILVAWKELLTAIAPASDERRVDRQPYIQLAKALAAAGDDRAAGCVYYERRTQERWAHWNAKHRVAWLANGFYGVLARYGVRPYRLLTITLSLVLVGGFVFAAPGAVVFANDKLTGQPKLKLFQALIMSAGRVIPVDLGLGSQWKPSTQILASLANTGLKFCGWLIIPVAVAAVTRATYRRFVEG